MYYNRIIPCLLLSEKGLVKTVKFRSPNYIGDPVNAVRIFNEKHVDELIFLDIEATRRKRGPDIDYLKNITSQCFMPLCYGGGVTSMEEVQRLFAIGFEKVAFGTAAFRQPDLVREAAERFGSQSISGVIDVKRNLAGRYKVWIECGRGRTGKDPVEYAHYLEQLGVGEILVNNISRDGVMSGYDRALVARVAGSTHVPVIVCGGAGRIEDMVDIVTEGKADAAAAGSIFVYYGINRAVLINYPTEERLAELFEKRMSHE